MNKRINFEDNIFILSQRIRIIRDSLILDADPELFLEITLDDVDFIDHAMTILLKNLTENTRLIERDEQLYNLSRTEYQFGEVLSEFSNETGSISISKFPLISEKLDILRKQSLVRQQTISGSITEPDEIPDNTVVSSDELMELLKDF
jgi:hypothetical protein